MSNEELVAVIQAGATERMGELWEQVKGLVAWKARHIMTALDLRGSPCGVEYDDLVQSGYLAMVAAVDGYSPDKGAFTTWLMYHLKTAFAEATGYRTKQGQNEPLNTAVSLDKTVDDEDGGTPFGAFVQDIKATATPPGWKCGGHCVMFGRLVRRRKGSCNRLLRPRSGGLRHS